MRTLILDMLAPMKGVASCQTKSNLFRQDFSQLWIFGLIDVGAAIGRPRTRDARHYANTQT